MEKSWFRHVGELPVVYAEFFFFLQAKDGILDLVRSRGLGDVYKRQKEGHPDLVLLDLILPGIDGFEVLAQKREDPFMVSIPVIILSNLGQKEDVDKGLSLGAADYLIKAHFTPGEIIEKVRNHLK